MARTAGGPIVKEIKPGGLIGNAEVTCRKIPERGKRGTFMYRYTSKTEWLDEYLELHQSEDTYQNLDELELPIINTGENALFTKAEFKTITVSQQIELI